MARPSLRSSLLEAGLRAMAGSGYNGTSVRDVTAAADAPLGSFSNHFRSKEAFALEILDRYFEEVRALLRLAFDDRSLGPRDRLRRYLDIVTDRAAERGWSQGCMIGDFSLETSGQNEALRTRLVALFREWLEPFAACIAEAQAAGQISADFAPIELAEFLMASWQGAILRMKVERSPAALDRFKEIVFRTVLSGPPSKADQ